MVAPPRPLIASLVVAALVAGLLALTSHGAVATSGPVAKGHGAFHADCFRSHQRADDPIVFPRGPGASHMHDFIGNRSTDAFSTPASLRKASTNCVRTNARAKGADRSAYWVPALYVGDQQVLPSQAGVYYNTGFRHMRAIEPFPKDLRVIAGDSKGKASFEANGQQVISFECPGGVLLRGSATQAPTCKTSRLDLTIRFPDCWDGVHSDSRDHKSHMAYSRQAKVGAPTRVCPTTHPRLMPMLVLKPRYPTVGGPLVRLASGGINTAHADFMNGWDQTALTGLVRDCLKLDKYCGGGDYVVPNHP